MNTLPEVRPISPNDANLTEADLQCPRCGSTDIIGDATAYWNGVEFTIDSLRQVHNMRCAACSYEVSVEAFPEEYQ